jgi:hypothetical protein
MKPEALDAFANHTMRPSALEAATTRNPEEGTAQVDGTSPEDENVSNHLQTISVYTYFTQPQSPATPKQPSTPFGQRIDGTQSAVKVVEEVVHGVKAAVDGAIAWAEKKADALSSESDSTGPYTSIATCVPSDMDPIASGALPAVLKEEEKSEEDTMKEKASKAEDGETEADNPQANGHGKRDGGRL